MNTRKLAESFKDIDEGHTIGLETVPTGVLQQLARAVLVLDDAYCNAIGSAFHYLEDCPDLWKELNDDLTEARKEAGIADD